MVSVPEMTVLFEDAPAATGCKKRNWSARRTPPTVTTLPPKNFRRENSIVALLRLSTSPDQADQGIDVMDLNHSIRTLAPADEIKPTHDQYAYSRIT
jgi:hypothetical protein